MRFYELNAGKIRIDGVPIEELTRENIHDLFCMVLQDTWLFEGSIKENVRYSRTDRSDEDVMNVCKAVGLHHYIETLPQEAVYIDEVTPGIRFALGASNVLDADVWVNEYGRYSSYSLFRMVRNRQNHHNRKTHNRAEKKRHAGGCH